MAPLWSCPRSSSVGLATCLFLCFRHMVELLIVLWVRPIVLHEFGGPQRNGNQIGTRPVWIDMVIPLDRNMVNMRMPRLRVQLFLVHTAVD
jgi:hypothetical protein